jgi:hypothetical protein
MSTDLESKNVNVYRPCLFELLKAFELLAFGIFKS